MCLQSISFYYSLQNVPGVVPTYTEFQISTSKSLSRMKAGQVAPAAQNQTKQSFKTSPKLSTIYSMPDKPQLYSYFHSSCSWRVRIALNLRWSKCQYTWLGMGENNILKITRRSILLSKFLQLRLMVSSWPNPLQSWSISMTHTQKLISYPRIPTWKPKCEWSPKWSAQASSPCRTCLWCKGIARTRERGCSGPSTGSL